MTREDIHRKLQPIVKFLNHFFIILVIFAVLVAVGGLVAWLATLFPYVFIVGPILAVVGIYVTYYITKPKVQSEQS